MNYFKHKLFQTLFIDIETVSIKSTFDELSPSMQNLWKSKASNLAKNSLLNLSVQLVEDLYCQKAAIYAEFGKIVCISVGAFKQEGSGIVFKKRSFANDSERKLLNEFLGFIKRFYNNPGRNNICGHNIKEFDIPYICRRALINGISLPSILQLSGKKPWEIDYLQDTLHLWKFGDYKHYTSLSLMCDIFNIPSPKSNLDGSMVGDYYWKEDRLEEIKEYCESDVEATAFLYAKLTGKSKIIEEVIEYRERTEMA